MYSASIKTIYLDLSNQYKFYAVQALKGIVSPDWKGLLMVSLDRFEI
jgi:hypothetical protein